MAADPRSLDPHAVIVCRDARAEDLRAVTTLHIRAWQHAYRGLVPQKHLDSLDVEEAITRRAVGWPWPGSLVAELDGVVAGWAAVGPYRYEGCPPGSGEIYAIYVHPEYWSAGVGRCLLQHSLDRLTDMRLAPIFLWVLGNNVRARRFYEMAGFAADGAEEGFEVGDAVVPEVRYRYTGLRGPVGVPS